MVLTDTDAMAQLGYTPVMDEPTETTTTTSETATTEATQPTVTTTIPAEAAKETELVFSSKPAAATPVQFDFSHVVDKEGKPYSVKDIFKLEKDLEPSQAYERLTKWDEINNHLNTFKSENETLKNTNPFADDYVKNLNEAVKSGVPHETFNKVYNTDPEKLTPTQKLILKFQWENNVDEPTAKILVEDEYKLGLQKIDEISITEEMTPDEKLKAEIENSRIKLHNSGIEQQKKVADARMQIDANKAHDFINKYKQQALTPPPIVENTEIEQRWSEPIKNLTSEFSEVSMGDDFKYQTDPKELQQIEEVVLKTLKDYKATSISPENPNHANDVRGMIKAEWYARNFVPFVKNLNAYHAAQMLKLKFNPSSLASNADNKKAETAGEKTPEDLFREMKASGY